MREKLKYKKIEDKELENVSGGTCYSSITYAALKIQSTPKYGQNNSFHPIITTAVNTCKLGLFDRGKFGLEIENCGHCLYCQKRKVTRYCENRSRECDKAK